MLTHKPGFMAEFAALPDRTRSKTSKIVDQLERTHGRADGMKKLKNVRDTYRVAVDRFRLVYLKRDDAVKMICVRPRKDVYKSLGIVEDEELLRDDPFEDDPLEDARTPSYVAPVEGDLPRVLDVPTLKAWRVPAPHHDALGRCRTQDQLQEAKIPYDVFSRVVDLLWPSTLEQLEHSADHITPSREGMERYVAGELTTFLLNLDDDQKRIAELNLMGAAGPTLVKGGPGSGKSTVALYRIKRLFESHADSMFGPPKVLFTTYTKALTKANSELLRSLLGPMADQVEVATIDSLARRVVDACEGVGTIIGETDPLAFSLLGEAKGMVGPSAPLGNYSDGYLLEEFFDVLEAQCISNEAEYLEARRHGRKAPMSKEARRAMWTLYEAFLERTLARNVQTWEGLRRRAAALVRMGRYAERFDYVVVDEAQDLTPNGMRLAVELSREPWGLYLTADANQSLYQKGATWTSLHPDLKVVGRTHVLKRNYRNTREISHAVLDLMRGVDGSDEEAAWEEGGLSGERPQVVETTANDEIVVLRRVLREACRKHKQPLMNACVLIAGDQQRAAQRGVEIAKLLTHEGVKANYMSSSGLRLDARCVKVLSMHASKGLEFPIVVIVDMHEGILPRVLPHLPIEEAGEEERKDRRLFFVGASRAMRSLTIVTHEQIASPFVLGLSAERWSLPAALNGVRSVSVPA